MYFKANKIYELSWEIKRSMNETEYRNYLIRHLNQSLFASSPLGRLIADIKEFLDKNIELKN